MADSDGANENKGAASEPAGPVVGLLGFPLDIFGLIGLGLGATPRARELVLKGLLSEYCEELEKLSKSLKRGRGRPRKAGPSIDEQRAAAVLGAADLLRDKFGIEQTTQIQAIDVAKQIDQALVSRDLREKRLFPDTTTTTKRLQTSVSAGLRELGQSGRFSKKSGSL